MFSRERITWLNEMLGKPKSAAELSKRYIDLGRQTGKSTLLIEALPDAPCIVACHSYDMSKIIMRRIHEIRPQYDLKQITFVIAFGDDIMAKLATKLRGLTGEVFVDNAIWDIYLQQEMVRFHERFNETGA